MNIETINLAQNYAILNEAANIVEDQLLSKVKIKNRKTVAEGLVKMEAAIAGLFKYGDFTDQELDTMRRARQHLHGVRDILDNYAGTQARNYDKMKTAINAVSHNIGIQILHKEEQDKTAELADDTAVDLDSVARLHQDWFKYAFLVTTRLEEEQRTRFVAQLNNLANQFQLNKIIEE